MPRRVRVKLTGQYTDSYVAGAGWRKQAPLDASWPVDRLPHCTICKRTIHVGDAYAIADTLVACVACAKV